MITNLDDQKTMFNRLRLYVWTSCVLFFTLAFPFQVESRDDVYTPKRGTEERKEIMDALRVPVQKDLGQRVIFVVDRLKVYQNWAFLFGTPKKSSGKPIDYRKTRYWEDYKMGFFDDNISALLTRKNGRWEVLVFVIGATDVVWETWPKDFGAPAVLFKY